MSIKAGMRRWLRAAAEPNRWVVFTALAWAHRDLLSVPWHAPWATLLAGGAAGFVGVVIERAASVCIARTATNPLVSPPGRVTARAMARDRGRQQVRPERILNTSTLRSRSITMGWSHGSPGAYGD